MDFFLGGAANGPVASALARNGNDVRRMRPFHDGTGNGKSYIVANDASDPTGKKEVSIPVANTNAYFSGAEWQEIDDTVQIAARKRLRGVADLRKAGLEKKLDGLGKFALLSARQSDITEARLGMDPRVQSQTDRPEYDLVNVPLPVIYKHIELGAREIAASRNGNMPVDTASIDLATRQCAELAEQLLFGTAPSSVMTTFVGSTIYGYTTFPDANTQVLTDPTSTAWTPQTLIDEVISMQEKSIADKHYGGWGLYFSPGWRQYLEEDYKNASSGSSATLRQRIANIDGIEFVEIAYFMNDMEAILVEMQSNTVREIIGLEFVVVQYASPGDFQQNIVVMCIYVPQIRSDFNGNCGLVYGAVS